MSVSYPAYDIRLPAAAATLLLIVSMTLITSTCCCTYRAAGSALGTRTAVAKFVVVVEETHCECV